MNTKVKAIPESYLSIACFKHWLLDLLLVHQTMIKEFQKWVAQLHKRLLRFIGAPFYIMEYFWLLPFFLTWTLILFWVLF